MNSRLRRLRLLASLLTLSWGITGHAATPSADGLYAGCRTSMGEFWCRLEYDKAPRTVANFVSLAEGTRDWIDFPTSHVVRRPFYDGLTFHRVIPGFMIQGGSPNGRGTDGPGYRFADEFHPELRHARAGILSMANSGPDSNGGQFFITVTNTPWLDDAHAVFGEVVEGLEVVHAISQVPRDDHDRPRTPVVLEEVRILRVGSAAQAFAPEAVIPALPAVGVEPVAIVWTGDTLSLRLEARTNRFLHVFAGTELGLWTYVGWATTPVTNIPVEQIVQAPYPSLPRAFFRLLQGGLEP